MLYDEIEYPDPYKFNPDRVLLNSQLNPEVRDPSAVFGFGKRRAVGDDGEILEPSYEYHSTLILMPLPFKCSIKPRSKAAANLIRSTANYSRHT
ncbi:hypothetical protein C8J57DRAFT_1274917 [Mycena rebaudengoi]|nr:hypothetical protein C8J57DRAFT_1274917 [Mycena rebaudengoi]